jgi:hypothetical protein
VNAPLADLLKRHRRKLAATSNAICHGSIKEYQQLDSFWKGHDFNRAAQELLRRMGL